MENKSIAGLPMLASVSAERGEVCREAQGPAGNLSQEWRLECFQALENSSWSLMEVVQDHGQRQQIPGLSRKGGEDLKGCRLLMPMWVELE